MKNLFRKLLPAAALLLSVGTAEAGAQIIEGMTFSTQFAFTAGEAKFPAGTYKVKPMEGDPNVVEISSADGSSSAVVTVRTAETLAEPSKGEVTFLKSGSRYVLDAIYEEGSTTGAESISAHTAKRNARRSRRGAPTTVRVPATKSS